MESQIEWNQDRMGTLNLYNVNLNRPMMGI